MTRILILTTGALCRNPRAAKEAATLAEHGYDVTIVTVRNHRAAETGDEQLLRNARYRRVAVDLLPGFGASSARVIARRLRTRLAQALVRHTGFQSVHALGPATALVRAARRCPADLTIVHNEIALWAGIRLLREGRRVAADIEDWHSEDLLPRARRSRPLRLLRWIEQTILRRAAYVSTTSHALASALHERYGGNRPIVVANAFPLAEAPDFRRAREMPSLFWFSQTIGPGRGLERFLAAWQLAQVPSRLVLLGTVSEAYRTALIHSLAAELRGRTCFLPAVPTDELPRVIGQHEVGLALEESWIPNRDLTITNKILQYLNGGLAVVASDTAGQREVLAQNTQAGIVVRFDDPAVLARQLDLLLGNQAELLARRRAARQLAESVYCWERQQPHLLHAVATALSQ